MAPGYHVTELILVAHMVKNQNLSFGKNFTVAVNLFAKREFVEYNTLKSEQAF